MRLPQHQDLAASGRSVTMGGGWTRACSIHAITAGRSEVIGDLQLGATWNWVGGQELLLHELDSQNPTIRGKLFFGAASDTEASWTSFAKLYTEISDPRWRDRRIPTVTVLGRISSTVSLYHYHSLYKRDNVLAH